MYKRYVLSLIVSCFAVLAVFPFISTAQDDTCVVSAAYDEANEENLTNILRLFAFLGDDGVWDGEPETVGLYYAMMQSIREYYEDATVPTCAEDLNTAMIRTTTAMQDVLAHNWAMQAYPDNQRYVSRANQAFADLNDEWSALSQTSSARPFSSDE